MSHRPEQVASVIRRAVTAEIARGLHDPRIRGIVSVTRVTVDTDCSEATIHVSVLPAEHERLTLEGLRSAAVHLQHAVREGLPLRRMPHLRFVADDSLKRIARTNEAIARGRAEDDVADDPAPAPDA